ncbi:MAG: PqqD family protein [Verrucomicrobiales bacterium]|nr:PqqD family protein [Verrucomicrobiales bacterium]
MKSDICYQIDENQVSHNDFGDEVVVIHFQTGNYFSLRSGAATLWRDLQRGPQSAEQLGGNFADPPEDVAEIIAKFLKNLQARELVLPIDIANDNRIAPVENPFPYENLELEVFEDLQALLVADVIHDTDEQGWPQMEPDAVA